VPRAAATTWKAATGGRNGWNGKNAQRLCRLYLICCTLFGSHLSVHRLSLDILGVVVSSGTENRICSKPPPDYIRLCLCWLLLHAAVVSCSSLPVSNLYHHGGINISAGIHRWPAPGLYSRRTERPLRRRTARIVPRHVPDDLYQAAKSSAGGCRAVDKNRSSPLRCGLVWRSAGAWLTVTARLVTTTGARR